MKQKRTQVDKLHIIHSSPVYGEGFIRFLWKGVHKYDGPGQGEGSIT